MKTLAIDAMTFEQDQQISTAVEQEGKRLRNFIRARVEDPADVEDILQDVFSELVEAYRLAKPVQQATAWLFQVAKNRIIDRFRKKRTQAVDDIRIETEDGEMLLLQDILPSPDAGPEASFAHSVLVDELEDALAELPGEQRAVFIAHEIEGKTFAELADQTGLSINTLLSRKRYAVLHLRRRLQSIYDEL
ncbi:MAG TPA: RNA polymerase sigma factor [Terriglobales bacterium]|nr:RNA polymerase sigma factor [Terriglobales bacterium]